MNYKPKFKPPQVLWIRAGLAEQGEWFPVVGLSTLNYSATWASKQFFPDCGDKKRKKVVRLLPFGKYPKGKLLKCSSNLLKLIDAK